MIRLDLDRVVPEDVALIIAHPTGVIYTARAGGQACTHPACEGYALPIECDWGNFDDCSYGCEYIPLEPAHQRKLADDLNAMMLRDTEQRSYHIAFDYTRIAELMEGWWPVTIRGEIDGTPINGMGYIHAGNCD